MTPADRDLRIVKHIVGYCGQIEETVRRFGNAYEQFQTDVIYRNAVALCILQIGELSGKLSDDFKAAYAGIPWKQMRAMRNIVAHSYGSVDAEVTWEVVCDDIPRLKEACIAILNTRE